MLRRLRRKLDRETVPADGNDTKFDIRYVLHECSSLFFLAVIGIRPVFSLIMLLLNMRGQRGNRGIQLEGSESHLGDLLQDKPFLYGIRAILPPDKGSMSGHQHARGGQRIQAGKTLDDDGPRRALIPFATSSAVRKRVTARAR